MSAPGRQGLTFPVYTKGFRAVYHVPWTNVFHLPEGYASGRHVVVCNRFDPLNPDSSCPSLACTFAHVDIRAVQPCPIHVNFAWRSLQAVKYKRCPPGLVFDIKQPNCRMTVDRMDSSCILQTQGSSRSNPTKVSHCAHYYYNRVCHLGPECQFIHAVFIDPEARPGQRAPIPSVLGGGREIRRRQHDSEGTAPRRMITDAESTTVSFTDFFGNDLDEFVAPDALVDDVGRIPDPPPATRGTPAFRFNPYSQISSRTFTVVS
jgi:hypothetical protein